MILRGSHQAWSNKNSYIFYSLIDLDITYRLGSMSFSLTPKYAQFYSSLEGRRPMVMGNGVSHGFPQGAARRQVLAIVFLMLKSRDLVAKSQSVSHISVLPNSFFVYILIPWTLTTCQAQFQVLRCNILVIAHQTNELSPYLLSIK